MSRRRYLSTRISLDARINRLVAEGGDFAALLYTWLIPHAEDDASLPADPEEILMAVIPGRRDKTAADVGAAVRLMLELGLLEHTPNGRRLRFPDSFYEYQTYIRGERRKTPQPRTNKEDATENSAEPRESAQNSAEQRNALNGADLRLTRAGFSVSSSFSPSFSVSSSPPLGETPDAGAEPEPAPPAAPPPVAPEQREDLLRLHEVFGQLKNRQYEPTPEFLRKVGERYPQLDLEVEALKLADWLKMPVHRKETCSQRRILNWLDRAEEDRLRRLSEREPPRVPVNGAAEKPYVPIPPPEPRQWTAEQATASEAAKRQARERVAAIKAMAAQIGGGPSP